MCAFASPAEFIKLEVVDFSLVARLPVPVAAGVAVVVLPAAPAKTPPKATPFLNCAPRTPFAHRTELAWKRLAWADQLMNSN